MCERGVKEAVFFREEGQSRSFHPPITVLRTLPTHLQVNAPLCPGTCDPDHSPDERQLFMKASDESLSTEEAFGMRGETSLLDPYGLISPG